MSQQQSDQMEGRWDSQHPRNYSHDQRNNRYGLQDGPIMEAPRLIPAETTQGQQNLLLQGQPNVFNSPQTYGPPYDPSYSSASHYNAYTTTHDRQTSWSSSGEEPLNEPSMTELGSMQLGDRTQSNARRVSFNPAVEAFRSQVEPRTAITDPKLLEKGGEALRMIHPSPANVPPANAPPENAPPENAEETLDPRYKVRDRPSRFFVEGRVFLILWAEPASESNQSSASMPTMVSGRWTSVGALKQPVYQKVRRFVVVRESEQSCLALPVGTYGGRGVSKDKVKKSDHAIIYTGKVPSKPLEKERPNRGELPMREHSIRVDPDEREDKLDSMSRIDFGKPHTIHHNLKVRPFGMVNNRWMIHLINQYQAVMLEKPIQAKKLAPHKRTPQAETTH